MLQSLTPSKLRKKTDYLQNPLIPSTILNFQTQYKKIKNIRFYELWKSIRSLEIWFVHKLNR